jgi:hypothetical protein
LTNDTEFDLEMYKVGADDDYKQEVAKKEDLTGSSRVNQPWAVYTAGKKKVVCLFYVDELLNSDDTINLQCKLNKRGEFKVSHKVGQIIDPNQVKFIHEQFAFDENYCPLGHFIQDSPIEYDEKCSTC